ncbi:MarR family winged helix-turn-helix transcriptional regulator, partial [Actinomadura sp. HBU206391]|uniref:MarR family winged helix-turn-helix transcriptional regulator n=1 Tax=Actinomadura sp. HBU206391 TaxID=2731692 RepID=UPI001DABD039|nr:MarR family transcriptional regulator [Actinomadura sp. HBU206391]
AARELHLADNSVSTLVNQLIGAQMLRREIDPADRRAARLVLTPAAQRRIAEWRDRRARLVGARLDVLSGDDRAAIAAALPALRRLLAEMQEPMSDTESQEPTSDDAGEPPSGTPRQ